MAVILKGYDCKGWLVPRKNVWKIKLAWKIIEFLKKKVDSWTGKQFI
jgi:hypothetical protein